MMSKIVKSLNSVNSFSKNIIITGCGISLLLCVVGIAIIAYNNIITKEVELYTIGSTMIHTSTILFAQLVIGGLLIDTFSTMMNNRDD